MGRGDYFGGSTIIGPRSGWFSGVGRASSKTVPSKSGTTSNLGAEHRLHYLHAVIQAELTAKTPPAIPKKAKANLQALVDAKGGPLAWARSQVEYHQFRDKKLRKQKKKTATSKEAVEKAIPSVSPPPALRNLDDEVADQLKVIGAAMAQVSSLIRQIADRQARIEELLSNKRHDGVD
ncbi:hypothetical protein EHI42_08665 [Rhizobium hidalgonense]|uniref:hypothetical protein n=1 Tax=Rhizobium hidalgonense TaxID=1538159 RepID=UPI000FEC5721|nr:hypothetical protein [Rhizobium hidalgonense]RWX18277.1 hypothetical protein EHI42_08665 [Rhizobium hidalgonense]